VIRTALLAAVLLAPAQDEPKLPPFRVVIQAKTGKLVPGDLQPLLLAIARLKGTVEQVGRERVPGDVEWFEAWTFQIPGEKKFDPTPLWTAFSRYNARKYHLEMTGTLSLEAQTKKLFITSYSGKSKVKLMNRPKDMFDKEEKDKKAEDNVAKLAGLLEEGKPHFTVRGDIFNHGGALAILLESFEEAAPPPPPKEKGKEGKK
jgi:hypothetical protein